jgi:hypothetical protein
MKATLPQKNRGERKNYRKDSSDDFVIVVNELALAGEENADATPFRDWMQLSLLIGGILCLLCLIAVCI